MPIHDAFCIHSRNRFVRDVGKLEICRNRLSQPSYISKEYLSLLEKDIACLVSAATLHAQQPSTPFSSIVGSFSLSSSLMAVSCSSSVQWHASTRERPATLICTVQRAPASKNGTFKRKVMDNASEKDLSARHLIAKFGEECHAVYSLRTIPFEETPAIIRDMRAHLAIVVSRPLRIDIMINNRVLCT